MIARKAPTAMRMIDAMGSASLPFVDVAATGDDVGGLSTNEVAPVGFTDCVEPTNDRVCGPGLPPDAANTDIWSISRNGPVPSPCTELTCRVCCCWPSLSPYH